LLVETETEMPVIDAFAGIENWRPVKRIVSDLRTYWSPSNVGVAVANAPSMTRANCRFVHTLPPAIALAVAGVLAGLGTLGPVATLRVPCHLK
jgi:hypothetical protein